MYYFAGHRATHWLLFPCCLCAEILSDGVESVVYIAGTGRPVHIVDFRLHLILVAILMPSTLMNNSILMATVPLDFFLNKTSILEKGYSSCSKLTATSPEA